MTQVESVCVMTVGRIQLAGETRRHLQSAPRSLTMAESQLLVDRNTRGGVRYPLTDGVIASSRVRYARQSSALYMPAWANVDEWYDDGVPELECDVSEVDGHSCWRYVWLRGRATSLFPTGRKAERQAWREGVAALRRTFTNIGGADDLALANFGIVRLDVELWRGAIVTWE
jgi:hypothetical protein